MRRLLTAVLVIAALGALGVVVWSIRGDDDATTSVEVSSDDRAVSVQDAVTRQPTVAFAVRGYAYDDGAFVQLCNGLTGDDPPKCLGPSVLLENLDLARLPIVTAEIDGTKVRYTKEPVVIGGTLFGTVLTVEDVLPTGD